LSDTADFVDGQTKLILHDRSHLIVSRNIIEAENGMNTGHLPCIAQVERSYPRVGMRAVDDASHEKPLVDENIVDVDGFTGDVLFGRFVVQ
jgi:hypothetical protein